MSHGPTYFESKGRCIFCGTKDKKLTDEHIVPYALGGQHVIRAASCLNCADITKKFEQRVARDLWGDARISFDAPSRRKKERKKSIAMIDPENLNKEVDIPSHEYPAGFVFYKMDTPGILQGLPENMDISKTWKLIMLDDIDRRNAFLEKKLGRLILKFRHVPQEFGQLLSKIAYCHFLSILDMEDFNPICLPYILGEKENVSYVVGGTNEETTPIPNLGYSLGTSGVVNSGKMALIATIRLYANMHTPEYQVVVGEVIGPAEISLILKKLKKYGPLTLTPL